MARTFSDIFIIIMGRANYEPQSFSVEILYPCTASASAGVYKECIGVGSGVAPGAVAPP